VAEMTAKQKLFCDEYLVDLNATQAAIRAGYSERTAYRTGADNLKKPHIWEYIKARMAEKEADLIATQDEVLKYLTAVLRGEEMDERVSINSMGEVERIEVRQQSNQLKAAEMLAKRYGLLVEKVDSTVDMDLNIKIDYGEDAE